jgi:hypothetical protein
MGVSMGLAEIRQVIESRTFVSLDTWLAIIGLAASGLFYFWSKREAVPTASIQFYYWLKSTNGPHEDLQVTFKGEPVARVGNSVVMFWNAGNHVLSGADFATNSGLRIAVREGIQVFGVKIVKTDPSDLSLSVSKTSVDKADTDRDIGISFDFLRSGEGFKIQLCHDGEAKDCVRLLGRYGGSSTLKIYSGGFESWKTKGAERILDLFFFTVFALVGLLGFLGFFILGKSLWQNLGGLAMLVLVVPLWRSLSARAGPKSL